MTDVSATDRVWVEDRGRWYPGVLETWNTRDRVIRAWVSYAVPINGWAGGWYEVQELLIVPEDEDPNDEGKSWITRVEGARNM